MAGTLSSALRNAASDSAARALIPARSSSLFLTERVSFVARCLSASSTTYSSLGIVKLSRTSFGFLGFSTLTVLLGLAVLADLTAGFLTAALRDAGLAAGFLASVGFWAEDLTVADFAAVLDVGAAGAGVVGAGVAAIDFEVAMDVP